MCGPRTLILLAGGKVQGPLALLTDELKTSDVEIVVGAEVEPHDFLEST